MIKEFEWRFYLTFSTCTKQELKDDLINKTSKKKEEKPQNQLNYHRHHDPTSIKQL